MHVSDKRDTTVQLESQAQGTNFAPYIDADVYAAKSGSNLYRIVVVALIALVAGSAVFMTRTKAERGQAAKMIKSGSSSNVEAAKADSQASGLGVADAASNGAISEEHNGTSKDGAKVDGNGDNTTRVQLSSNTVTSSDPGDNSSSVSLTVNGVKQEISEDGSIHKVIRSKGSNSSISISVNSLSSSDGRALGGDE